MPIVKIVAILALLAVTSHAQASDLNRPYVVSKVLCPGIFSFSAAHPVVNEFPIKSIQERDDGTLVIVQGFRETKTRLLEALKYSVDFKEVAWLDDFTSYRDSEKGITHVTLDSSDEFYFQPNINFSVGSTQVSVSKRFTNLVARGLVPIHDKFKRNFEIFSPDPEYEKLNHKWAELRYSGNEILHISDDLRYAIGYRQIGSINNLGSIRSHIKTIEIIDLKNESSQQYAFRGEFPPIANPYVNEAVLSADHKFLVFALEGMRNIPIKKSKERARLTQGALYALELSTNKLYDLTAANGTPAFHRKVTFLQALPTGLIAAGFEDGTALLIHLKEHVSSAQPAKFSFENME